jgi:hypothetical protein
MNLFGFTGRIGVSVFISIQSINHWFYFDEPRGTRINKTSPALGLVFGIKCSEV